MSLKQRGHAMRTFDFAPFYRSTVGFDRLFSMLDQVGGVEGAAAPGYPPYNVKRSGENAYNISIAVAGFAGEDLSIVGPVESRQSEAGHGDWGGCEPGIVERRANR